MRWVRFLLLVPLSAAVQQPSFAQKQATPTVAPMYPNDVALVEEGERGAVYSVYRQARTSLRLYTSDRDLPGQSTCYDSCAMAWPILPAAADAVPVGEWSIVTRRDGTRQWAFRGKPVYLRFHDAPDRPSGDGIEGVWHVIAYSPAK